MAWMTNRLQNPSSSWKIGEDHRRIASQLPIVKFSSRPSLPNTASQRVESVLKNSLFVLKVLSTQPELLSASTENLPKAQIHRIGRISSCSPRRMFMMDLLKLGPSGVDILSRDRRK